MITEQVMMDDRSALPRSLTGVEIGLVCIISGRVNSTGNGSRYHSCHRHSNVSLRNTIGLGSAHRSACHPNIAYSKFLQRSWSECRPGVYHRGQCQYALVERHALVERPRWT